MHYVVHVWSNAEQVPLYLVKDWETLFSQGLRRNWTQVIIGKVVGSNIIMVFIIL